MKYIIIKKTGRISNDFSCENIIRFTANLNRYADNNIVTTSEFIFARVPEKLGDMAGAERFFESVDMFISDPPKCMSFEYMEGIVKKAFHSKKDVGYSLIQFTVKHLLPRANYDYIDM